MTKEEAIAILEVSKHMATSGRMYNQAIDMAIEALSAEPKEKKDDDSLLTDSAEVGKENECKLSREDARYFLQGISDMISLSPEAEMSIDMAIEALHREEAEEKGYCHRIKPKEYLSADAVPTVIRSKTLLPTKDFKEWAKRIKEVNPNAVVIPCDAEVASADAIHSGGVFVPNMEMPKVCDYCLFHDSEWSWCKAKDKYCGDGKCPLIAVRGERREP